MSKTALTLAYNEVRSDLTERTDSRIRLPIPGSIGKRLTIFTVALERTADQLREIRLGKRENDRLNKQKNLAGSRLEETNLLLKANGERAVYVRDRSEAIFLFSLLRNKNFPGYLKLFEKQSDLIQRRLEAGTQEPITLDFLRGIVDRRLDSNRDIILVTRELQNSLVSSASRNDSGETPLTDEITDEDEKILNDFLVNYESSFSACFEMTRFFFSRYLLDYCGAASGRDPDEGGSPVKAGSGEVDIRQIYKDYLDFYDSDQEDKRWQRHLLDNVPRAGDIRPETREFLEIKLREKWLKKRISVFLKCQDLTHFSSAHKKQLIRKFREDGSFPEIFEALKGTEESDAYCDAFMREIMLHACQDILRADLEQSFWVKLLNDSDAARKKDGEIVGDIACRLGDRGLSDPEAKIRDILNGHDLTLLSPRAQSELFSQYKNSVFFKAAARSVFKDCPDLKDACKALKDKDPEPPMKPEAFFRAFMRELMVCIVRARLDSEKNAKDWNAFLNAHTVDTGVSAAAKRYIQDNACDYTEDFDQKIEKTFRGHDLSVLAFEDKKAILKQFESDPQNQKAAEEIKALLSAAEAGEKAFYDRYMLEIMCRLAKAGAPDDFWSGIFDAQFPFSRSTENDLEEKLADYIKSELTAPGETPVYLRETDALIAEALDRHDLTAMKPGEKKMLVRSIKAGKRYKELTRELVGKDSGSEAYSDLFLRNVMLDICLKKDIDDNPDKSDHAVSAEVRILKNYLRGSLDIGRSSLVYWLCFFSGGEISFKEINRILALCGYPELDPNSPPEDEDAIVRGIIGYDSGEDEDLIASQKSRLAKKGKKSPILKLLNYRNEQKIYDYFQHLSQS